MKLKEFRDLSKGDPDVGKVKVGDKFKPKEINESKYKPGQTVVLYQVSSVKPDGYEYVLVWELLEE